MSKESYHVQVKCCRPLEKGRADSKTEWYTAYIPEKYARIGNTIDIDDVGEDWMICWIGTPVLSDVVNERSQDYKRTRKASDI